MSDPNASVSAAAPETVETETYRGSSLPPEPTADKPRSLWSDAWRELRSSKIFILSGILIFVFLIMTFFPSLLTFGKDPYTCDLTLSRQGPSSTAWFGYDNNGCDVYTGPFTGPRHRSWSVFLRPPSPCSSAVSSGSSPGSSAAGWIPSCRGSPTSSSGSRCCSVASSS